MANPISFIIPPDNLHKTNMYYVRTCWKNTPISVMGASIIGALGAAFLTIAIANPNLLHLKGSALRIVQGSLGATLGLCVTFLGVKGVQRLIGSVSVSDEESPNEALDNLLSEAHVTEFYEEIKSEFSQGFENNFELTFSVFCLFVTSRPNLRPNQTRLRADLTEFYYQHLQAHPEHYDDIISNIRNKRLPIEFLLSLFIDKNDIKGFTLAYEGSKSINGPEIDLRRNGLSHQLCLDNALTFLLHAENDEQKKSLIDFIIQLTDIKDLGLAEQDLQNNSLKFQAFPVILEFASRKGCLGVDDYCFRTLTLLKRFILKDDSKLKDFKFTTYFNKEVLKAYAHKLISRWYLPNEKFEEQRNDFRNKYHLGSIYCISKKNLVLELALEVSTPVEIAETIAKQIREVEIGDVKADLAQLFDTLYDMKKENALEVFRELIGRVTLSSQSLTDFIFSCGHNPEAFQRLLTILNANREQPDRKRLSDELIELLRKDLSKYRTFESFHNLAKSYFEHCTEPKVLMLFYQRMQSDFPTEVLDVRNFSLVLEEPLEGVETVDLKIGQKQPRTYRIPKIVLIHIAPRIFYQSHPGIPVPDHRTELYAYELGLVKEIVLPIREDQYYRQLLQEANALGNDALIERTLKIIRVLDFTDIMELKKLLVILPEFSLEHQKKIVDEVMHQILRLSLLESPPPLKLLSLITWIRIKTNILNYKLKFVNLIPFAAIDAVAFKYLARIYILFPEVNLELSSRVLSWTNFEKQMHADPLYQKDLNKPKIFSQFAAELAKANR